MREVCWQNETKYFLLKNAHSLTILQTYTIRIVHNIFWLFPPHITIFTPIPTPYTRQLWTPQQVSFPTFFFFDPLIIEGEQRFLTTPRTTYEWHWLLIAPQGRAGSTIPPIQSWKVNRYPSDTGVGQVTTEFMSIVASYVTSRRCFTAPIPHLPAPPFFMFLLFERESIILCLPRVYSQSLNVESYPSP